MIQKIIKQLSKINQKSMEIEACTGLGSSWRKLWSDLGSQGRLEQKKKQNDSNMTASGLGSIFDIFRYVSMFLLRSFSNFHFDGYQDRFVMDFDSFFGLFLEVVFRIFRIVSK